VHADCPCAAAEGSEGDVVAGDAVAPAAVVADVVWCAMLDVPHPTAPAIRAAAVIAISALP
jgi:hypothetical protein